MAATALGVFLTIKRPNSSTVYHRWQNFWRVTVDGHQFQPFDADGLKEVGIGDDVGVQFSVPATSGMMKLVDLAMSRGDIFQFDLCEMTPGGAPSRGTVIDSFVGQPLSAVASDSVISLSIGTMLDPVTAQFPPRLYTSTLVGTPPKL